MFNNLFPKLDKTMHGGKSLNIGNGFRLHRESGGIALYSQDLRCAIFFSNNTNTIFNTDKTVVAVECLI